MLGSVFLASVLLVAVWVSALRASPDGVTTTTGARNGVALFAAIALIAIAVREVRIWAPRFLSWVPVLTSIVFMSIAGVLFTTGRLDTAFALYGGLQVSRSDKLFSDMHWVLSWFECNLCSQWDPHYGPTLQFLDPLSAGSLGLNWLVPLGVGTVIASLISIWLLARSTSSMGRWLLLIGTVSPAWLLLLDRANSDAIILAAIIIGGWVVSRWPAYWTWSAFAFTLWAMGTIKFYPFALGIVLLFALRLKRGWLIPAGFAGASALYLLVAWEGYERSSAWTVRPGLFDITLASYGRIYLENAISMTGQGVTFIVLSLWLLALVSAVWGWLSSVHERSPDPNQFVGLVALAGGVAFAGKVLWAGFGFAYTGAFLLLIVPAAARALRAEGTFSGNGVAAGLVIVFALLLPSDVILATVLGVVAAGFGIGAGLAIWLSIWRGNRKSECTRSFGANHETRETGNVA